MSRRPYVRHTPKVAAPAPVEATGLAQGERSLSPDPLRPDPRPEMRADSPRARAAARTAELRGHMQSMEEHDDRFFIDQDMIPDGWTYEWKRHTVLGKEDPAYQVQLARAGWDPVPVSRHPSYMPKDWRGNIERDGMILCERPTEIVEEARKIEQRKAGLQMRAKQEQLSGVAQGQFERQKSDGESLVKVKTSYEHIAIPES